MTDRRLIILGRSGQLARELAGQAPRRGWRIDALGRDRADFSSPEAAAAALRGAGPADAVINAAAYTAVDRAESEETLARLVNAETPGRLAQVCAQTGTPFLHVSTDYVFDGELGRPYRESDAPAPQSAYGRTKLAGEDAVRAAGESWLIARTAWVYSAYGANFVKTMLRVGAERDELRVVDDQIGCPTAAGDLAAGLLTAAEAMVRGASDGGLFHLAGTGETSWAGLAGAVFDRAGETWGRRPRVTGIPSKDYPTPAPRPGNSRLDCTLFERTFGWRAPPWRASLDTVLDDLLSASPSG